VLTPEDAFVAAANTCVMMMFLWACERFKIPLVAYACDAEGTKIIELDRTELFTKIVLRPKIRVKECDEARLRRALQAAQKFSLVANSVKSEVTIEPEILVQ
jgi:organic hydroperoxide reductase OsmC/OhrA